jgi:hypothetical protein
MGVCPIDANELHCYRTTQNIDASIEFQNIVILYLHGMSYIIRNIKHEGKMALSFGVFIFFNSLSITNYSLVCDAANRLILNLERVRQKLVNYYSNNKSYLDVPRELRNRWASGSADMVCVTYKPALFCLQKSV